MAGELWRQRVQIGKETTYGTAVAATRIIYPRTISTTKERESRPKAYMTGTRSQVRAHTQGPIMAGASLEMGLIPDDLLEILAITVQGGVTPTTPGGATNARLFTYTPGNTLDSATLEVESGAEQHQLSGCYGSSLTIAGGAEGESTVSVEVFAKDRDDTFSALTGALTDRVPLELEGWQTNLYITTFGGTPGAGGISDALVSYEVTFNNNPGRKFLANNTQTPNRVTLGMLDITANLVIDATSASAATLLANWLADTKALIRLEFIGPEDGIETGFERFLQIDLAGAWTTPDINQESQGTRDWAMPLTYVHDVVNAFPIRYRVQTDRTAAWT